MAIKSSGRLLSKKSRRVQTLEKIFNRHKAQKIIGLAIFIVGFSLSRNNTPSKNIGMFIIGGFLAFVGIVWEIAVFLAA